MAAVVVALVVDARVVGDTVEGRVVDYRHPPEDSLKLNVGLNCTVCNQSIFLLFVVICNCKVLKQYCDSMTP